MQNILEITVHSVDLSRFGLNPAGQPVFRVVWSPSRTEKLWYRETRQLIEVKTYGDREDWVLERWLPAMEYAGTREAFAEQQKSMPINMEYPDDGEYSECMAFPNNESVGLAPKAVELITAGTTQVSADERRQALLLREELREKDVDQKTSDAINDVLSPNWRGERVKLYDANGSMIH